MDSEDDISKYFSDESDKEIEDQVPNLEPFINFSEDDINQLKIKEGI